MNNKIRAAVKMAHDVKVIEAALLISDMCKASSCDDCPLQTHRGCALELSGGTPASWRTALEIYNG